MLKIRKSPFIWHVASTWAPTHLSGVVYPRSLALLSPLLVPFWSLPHCVPGPLSFCACCQQDGWGGFRSSPLWLREGASRCWFLAGTTGSSGSCSLAHCGVLLPCESWAWLWSCWIASRSSVLQGCLPGFQRRRGWGRRKPLIFSLPAHGWGYSRVKCSA